MVFIHSSLLITHQGRRRLLRTIIMLLQGLLLRLTSIELISYHSWKRALCFSLLILSFLGVSLGESSVSDASPLKARVISASKRAPAYVDPKLKDLRRSLKTSFPKFKRFKLQSMKTIALKQKAQLEMKVNAQVSAKIKVLKVSPKEIQLNILIPKKKVNLKVKARRGKRFFQAMKWKKSVYLIALDVPH